LVVVKTCAKTSSCWLFSLSNLSRAR